MKNIFIILLLWSIGYNNSYAQYFFNDSINNYFLKFIQEQNPASKNVAYISHFIGTYAQGVNPILNAGSKNYLANIEDSMVILKYLHDNAILFNMNSLIEFVKKDKADFYSYYNPIIKYDKTNADSIRYYPVEFFREYDDESFQKYKKLSQDKIYMDYKTGEYFRVVLDVDYTDNKIRVIKPLGIIAYGKRYYSNGTLYGYIGYGCFVAK